MNTPSSLSELSLPNYDAAEALRNGLIDHMIQMGCMPGDSFLSDREVMNATGKGRYSVRRALKLLQDEGWIERRVGTFVGPRIVDYYNGELTDQSGNPSRHGSTASSKGVLRLAVVASGVTPENGNDAETEVLGTHLSWYFGPVLQGVTRYAQEERFVVELISGFNSKADVLNRNLTQKVPDILLNIGSATHSLPVLFAAHHRKIPVILSVTRSPQYGMINIYEDNLDGSFQAVKYLYDHGHRRIGFLQILDQQTGMWSIDRHNGYRRALGKLGLPYESSLSCWFSIDSAGKNSEIVRQYIQKEKPTALICGCWHAAQALRDLTRNGLSIPRDLSVIVFDRNPLVPSFLGGTAPTTIALPLYQIGETVAKFVRPLIERPETVCQETVLPCNLIAGDSVASV